MKKDFDSDKSLPSSSAEDIINQGLTVARTAGELLAHSNALIDQCLKIATHASASADDFYTAVNTLVTEPFLDTSMDAVQKKWVKMMEAAHVSARTALNDATIGALELRKIAGKFSYHSVYFWQERIEKITLVDIYEALAHIVRDMQSLSAKSDPHIDELKTIIEWLIPLRDAAQNNIYTANLAIKSSDDFVLDTAKFLRTANVNLN